MQIQKGQQQARVDNEPNLKKGRQLARANNEPNFKTSTMGQGQLGPKIKVANLGQKYKENKPIWAVIRLAHQTRLACGARGVFHLDCIFLLSSFLLFHFFFKNLDLVWVETP
jgi:hypothetical protein